MIVSKLLLRNRNVWNDITEFKEIIIIILLLVSFLVVFYRRLSDSKSTQIS